MIGSWRSVVLALVLGGGSCIASASAQSLGSFSWQLAPYCNIITVSVMQQGSIYTLDGYDNQCGASERGSVSGSAFINPGGTVGLGLTTVTAPGGTPVHLEGVLDIVSLGGTWRDSHGNSGVMVFSPASAAGSPRPLGTGDIPDGAITSAKLADGAVNGFKIADGTVGAEDIDPAEVQRRIGAACPPDQMMTGVGMDGSVQCAAAGAGGITAITAGTGLAGGGSTGAVSLSVAFDGSGQSNSAARSDHTHELPGNNQSVAVGSGALSRTTSGAWNTAVGHASLQQNTSGIENAAFGSNTLSLNTTGDANTAIGTHALRFNTEGSSNVAAGVSALNRNRTGSNNTALGPYALNNFESGGSNIAIGALAGALLTSGDDNIYVGSSGNGTESNTTRIGRINQQTRVFVAGIRGVTTGQANAVGVVIDSSGQLGTVSSSRRTKFDIADLAPGVTGALHRLRPVQFRYRQAFADGSTPIQYGLIAEEVDEVMPELVAPGEDGTPETVKYHVLPSLLLADVQRLERERQRLETALANETLRVSELERRLEAQARALDELRGLVVPPQ